MVKLNTNFSAKKKSSLAVRTAVKGDKANNSKGSFSSSTLYLAVGDEKVYLGKIFGSKMNSTEKLDYMLDLVATGKAKLEIQKHESLKPEGKLKALLDAFDKANEETQESEDENYDEDVFTEDDEEEEE